MDKTMRFAAYLAYANRAKEPWISSRQVADYCDIQASQVRRDLATLKLIGRRGTGYRPKDIRELLTAELEPAADRLLEDSLRMALLAGAIHLAATGLKGATH